MPKEKLHNNRVFAWICTAAVIVVSLAGQGALGLNSLRGRAERAYTQTDKYGNSMASDFALRTDAAANIVTVGRERLGDGNDMVKRADAAVQAAVNAETAAQAAEANRELAASIELLYRTMDADMPQGERYSALQTQWSEFLSRGDILLHTDYNEKAAAYTQASKAFPANVLAKLFGLPQQPAWT